MQIYVEGSLQNYSPSDSAGIQIELGAIVTMPSPIISAEIKETWPSEGLRMRVEDNDERSGDIIVIDQTGDFHVVEPNRVKVVGKCNSPVFVG